jgi:uncharacterized protein YegP (UPF0339 family)
MSIRFELVQDSSSKFHFQLRAEDGSVMLLGLPCDNKLAAQNELQHTRSSLRDAARVVEHLANDQSRFVVVKDEDGSVLARSQHVPSASHLTTLVEAIRLAASGAPLVDLCKRRISAAG